MQSVISPPFSFSSVIFFRRNRRGFPGNLGAEGLTKRFSLSILLRKHFNETGEAFACGRVREKSIAVRAMRLLFRRLGADGRTEPPRDPFLGLIAALLAPPDAETTRVDCANELYRRFGNEPLLPQLERKLLLAFIDSRVLPGRLTAPEPDEDCRFLLAAAADLINGISAAIGFLTAAERQGLLPAAAVFLRFPRRIPGSWGRRSRGRTSSGSRGPSVIRRVIFCRLNSVRSSRSANFSVSRASAPILRVISGILPPEKPICRCSSTVCPGTAKPA